MSRPQDGRVVSFAYSYKDGREHVAALWKRQIGCARGVNLLPWADWSRQQTGESPPLYLARVVRALLMLSA